MEIYLLRNILLFIGWKKVSFFISLCYVKNYNNKIEFGIKIFKFKFNKVNKINCKM